MKAIKIFMSILAATAMTVACSDPNDGEMFVQPTDIETEMTATSILERDADEFSMFLELLKYADYYNALKNPDKKATVFCPSNEALQKYLSANGYSSVQDIPQDYAKKLVKVHIIPNEIVADNLLDTLASQSATHPTDLPYVTLFGTQLNVRYGYSITDVDDAEREPETVSHCPDSIFINNSARLDKFTALSCSNANLYTMGDVIEPLTEDIPQMLEKLGNYKIFAAAVSESGFSGEVSVEETDDDTENNVIVNRFTCFAVPDEVYAAAGINDVQGLKNYIQQHNEGNDRELLSYVKYHFLQREYNTSEIFDTTKVEQTVIFDTKYPGQVFTAYLAQDGSQTLNGTIRILRSNIETRNGLIHKVSEVMPVFHPAPVRVVWDFCNSADIIAYVNDWGQQNGLPNIFFSPMENKDRQIDLSTNNYDKYEGTQTITSFTHKYNESQTAPSKYRHVGFYKEKYESKKDVTKSLFGSYMNNFLILNLGYAGWIEFTSPSIIAGKYDIVLHHIQREEIQKLYNAGTRVRFNLDEEETEKLLYKGANKKTEGVVETTLWEDFTFSTSGYHTFKITFRDPQAKTTNYYHLPIDYLEFIPKN